jgi:hypothetical protein
MGLWSRLCLLMMGEKKCHRVAHHPNLSDVSDLSNKIAVQMPVSKENPSGGSDSL